METPLFRKQLLETQAQEWLGTVQLSTPISEQIWTVISLSIGAAITVWLFTGHYTRRVHVTGLLVPEAGLITVSVTSAGVGASGCGKSTLVRLLLGLLDPQQGTIRVGGMDLRHLGKTKYRSMTASVMQDDHLFTGSIADNISFFDEQATLEDIENAARLTGVHDDIIAMPMGYHSLVGDMGSSLSGGQRQRIYLARALYKRPRILVMDEATSHLDVNLEQQVNQAIAALNITRIIIAHRPETIKQADRVIELISGKARPRTAHMPQNGPKDAGSADTFTVTA